jgi:hypothetical protein
LRFAAGIAGIVLLALGHVGCGEGASAETSASSGDTEGQTAESALHRRRAPAPRPAPAPAPAPGGATGGSSGSGSAQTTEQVIKAAQTPDGAAIPQASGPGGTCPEVVVRIGFWSCPTIGDSCTYSNSGGTHHCACSRTDGEGQFPSWVCD